VTAGDVIKWGVLGLAAWWVYDNFIAPSSTAATTTTTPPAASSGTAASSSGTAASSSAAASSTPTAAAGSFTTLDAMYAALVAAAQAGMNSGDTGVTSAAGVLSANGDVWNFYLSQIDPHLNVSALDPTVIFAPNVTAANRSSSMLTSSAYWAGVSPTIRTQTGLSGLTVGLGAFVYGRRRFA